MRRKIFTILALAILHFIVCIILSFVVYFSTLVSFLGAESNFSDRAAAGTLIVLLFPVRNFANLLVSHPDQWLRDLSGLFVIAGASILWGIAIYYFVAWFKGRRHIA